LLVLLFVTAPFSAGAAQPAAPAVEFKALPVAGSVHVLAGGGGNVAVCVGEDGLLLVDSANPGLGEPLAAAVAKLSERPVRLVLNTHWHFDHVGGNEYLAQRGAIVVAHESVRQRMSSLQRLGALGREVPPSPPAALPMVTYADTLALHINGEEVRVLHIAPAHTDGDSFVKFEKANVLHVGDVFFNGFYPFIDVNAGGSIDGMLAAVDRALTLANDETQIIPGHGPLAHLPELRAYRQMLQTVRDRVRELVQQGKTRDEVIAAHPTQDLDAQWARGGMAPDVFVGVVYDGMKAKPTP